MAGYRVREAEKTDARSLYELMQQHRAEHNTAPQAHVTVEGRLPVTTALNHTKAMNTVCICTHTLISPQAEHVVRYGMVRNYGTVRLKRG